MSLESDLRELIKPLVGGRVYPDFAPPETEQPYITFIQIGGEAIRFIDRTTPTKRNAVVQIDVWSNFRAEAIDIIQKVEKALIESTLFQASPEAAAVSDYDEMTGRRRSRQDFSIWAER